MAPRTPVPGYRPGQALAQMGWVYCHTPTMPSAVPRPRAWFPRRAAHVRSADQAIIGEHREVPSRQHRLDPDRRDRRASRPGQRRGLAPTL